jgi:hypothetical protein
MTAQAMKKCPSINKEPTNFLKALGLAENRNATRQDFCGMCANKFVVQWMINYDEHPIAQNENKKQTTKKIKLWLA